MGVVIYMQGVMGGVMCWVGEVWCVVFMCVPESVRVFCVVLC